MSAIATAGKVAGTAKNVAAAAPTPSYGSDLTLPLVVGSIIIVGWGTVITEKKVDMKAILAGGVVAIGISVIDNVNEKMAEAFAGIIFLGVCYKFLPDVVSKLGYSNGGSGNAVDKSALKKSSPMPATPAINNSPGGTATPQNSGGTKQA